MSSIGIAALLFVGISLVVSSRVAPARASQQTVVELFGVSALSLAGLLAVGVKRV